MDSKNNPVVINVVMHRHRHRCREHVRLQVRQIYHAEHRVEYNSYLQQVRTTSLPYARTEKPNHPDAKEEGQSTENIMSDVCIDFGHRARQPSSLLN